MTERIQRGGNDENNITGKPVETEIEYEIQELKKDINVQSDRSNAMFYTSELPRMFVSSKAEEDTTKNVQEEMMSSKKMEWTKYSIDEGIIEINLANILSPL